jgi:cystathionine beta-synthase
MKRSSEESIKSPNRKQRGNNDASVTSSVAPPNPDGNLCQWKAGVGNEVKCPHLLNPRKRRPLIMSTILDNIGDTPLVRINNISKKAGLECELLV